MVLARGIQDEETKESELPPEMIQVELETSHNRIQSALESGENVPYRRTKLLFVGEGRAGKTSTINSLIGLEFNPDQASTLVAEAETDVAVSLQDISDEWKQQGNEERHLLRDDFRSVVRYADRKGKLGLASPSKDPSAQKVRVPVAKLVNFLTPTKPKSGNDHMPGANKEKPTALDNSETTGCDADHTATTRAKAQRKIQDKTYDPNKVSFTLWDFGGQSVFYTVHHLYLTQNGIYFVIFNMRQMIDDEAAAKQSLRFWLESIALHAPHSPVIVIGTHYENAKDEIKKINNIVRRMITTDRLKIEVQKNREMKLSFFPCDNSLGAANSKYLDPVKTVVKQLLQSKKSPLAQFLEKEVQLSWIYLMENMIMKYPQCAKRCELWKLGEDIGIPPKEIDAMLKFYTEVGAIVSFDSESSEDDAVRDIVILRPQWLLNALGTFLYDPELHSKWYDFPDDSEAENAIEEYEKTAIISKNTLQKLWKQHGLDHIEQGFLTALCSKMLLFSEYLYGTVSEEEEEEEEVTEDFQGYLVPGMIREQETLKEIQNLILDLDDELVAIAQFSGPIPKGFFERLICSLLTKSNAFEGSQKPTKLATNHATLIFQDVSMEIVLLSRERRVLVGLQKEQKEEAFQALKIFQEALEDLRKDAFGTLLGATLLLQAKHKEKLVECSFAELIVAVDAKKTNVKAFKSRKALPINLFSDFMAGKNQQILEEFEEHDTQFDCFLAHEWGTAADGYATHQKVQEIAEALRKRGLRVWLDENHLRGEVADGIMDGLDRSKCVVVFLTKRYLERCKNSNNNCTKEFKAAVKRHNVERTILALLDPSLRNPKSWSGPVDYHLSDKLYIDLTNENELDDSIGKLCDEIRKTCSK